MFSGLKGYKEGFYTKEQVAEYFPEVLAGFLKMINIKSAQLITAPIEFDWQKLMKFKMNFGKAIYTNNFDKLDDIILEFLNTYKCRISLTQSVVASFPEEAQKQLVQTCNSFKGKQWNDILEELVDALERYFTSGKISL